MLKNILQEITGFCRVIATVTGVDIEIVDEKLNRLAGTGIYANDSVKSIRLEGEIYRYALTSGSTVYVDNPREHALCQKCPSRNDCRELLTLCTPIVLGNKTMGVIGLICFSQEDRDRVLAQKELFIEFVQQIAAIISTVASNERRARKVSQMLDLLLQITDKNSHGILMLAKDGRISYANVIAREEFGLDEQGPGVPVSIRHTGNLVADMKEYEVGIGTETRHSFGRLIPLESDDDDFASVLLTEPGPQLTKMLSLFQGAGASSGGLADIIGESRVVKKLKERVLQIARTSSTVLIAGESGTGKEMFARAIHAESERKNKPFIAINCGAIPDTLLESELFGYVSGAFTGANNSGRMGKFELAADGVLFLDEISSMSLYLQVKLLRVLQEKSFTRLGSNRLISVDVRIIAASNEDLPELIAQKMFRDDLYYRLNVIPLELPPLRRRKEDLPLLAERFLDRYCLRFKKPPVRLTPAMLTMLQAYSWPGNVREFENCMEYLVNMHEGGTLSPALLPAKIHDAYVKDAGEFTGAPLPQAASGTEHRARPQRAASGAKDGPLPPLSSGAGGAEPEDATLPIVPIAALEKQAIRRAMALFGDSAEGKKKAAKALGIGVATLYRKLQSL